MKKRLFAVVLAALLVFSTFAGSVITAAAEEPTLAPPNPYRLPEYTPSSGITTQTLMLALPGAWVGEDGSNTRQTWEKYGSTAGLYWWESYDNPDDYPQANGHGWPGWKMKKGDQVNLYTTPAPKGAASMIFSNFIDGGMDTSYPEYDAAMQTKDLTQQEYYGEGDSDYYPKEFWDYVYSYVDDLADDPSFEIPGFGDYAKNFFYSADDDSIYHYGDNMVFVVDTVNTDRAQVSPVSGKPGLDGAFYFYYGNGEFGIWPTKEMCIEKEGLKADDQGNVLIAEETVQEKTDFVLRKHIDAYDQTTEREFVVFGNFTGKYWTDTTPPPTPDPVTTTAPNQAGTTIPGPDDNDAKSDSGSTSDSGSGSNDSNGSIATGQIAAPVLIATFLFAGLGVFYYVRKRRYDK